MSKILINTTASTVFINDTGVSIAGLASYTIPPQDYLLWAASSDVITAVGSGTLVVNDGSSNLTISSGTDLIKGIFPTKILTNQSGTEIYEYNEALSVVSGITTTVVTKTTSVAKKLTKVLYSGSNVAIFSLIVNGQTVAKRRTMFGSNLSGELDFGSGLDVPSGQTIELKVLHSRPFAGDFEGSLIFITNY